MSKKQFKTFCSIASFLEQRDPELYRILSNSCSLGLLYATKNKVGITFLWPQDKKFRDRLETLAYSATLEDVESAGKMLNNLILRDKFKNAQDWLQKRDDIPNALEVSQRLEITGAEGREVQFASGAKATLEESFVDASAHKNLSVWKLTGEIPITADKPATGKYISMAIAAQRKRLGKEGPKTGGAAEQKARAMRMKIAHEVENAFAVRLMSKRDALRDDSAPNAFVEAAASLILHLLDSASGDCATTALGIFSAHPLDFYLLLQPHLPAAAEAIIGDDCIENWWNGKARLRREPLSAMLQKIEQAAANLEAAIFSDRKAVNGAVENERKKLCGNNQINRNVLQSVAEPYQTLERDNRIGAVSNVLPESLHLYYAANPGLKRAEDGLKFMLYGMFCDLESNAEHGLFDHGLFKECLDIIGAVLGAADAESRDRLHPLLNPSAPRYTPEPSQLLGLIKSFICSSSFLQLPFSAKRAQYGKSQLTTPRPGSSTYYDIDAAIAKKFAT